MATATKRAVNVLEQCKVCRLTDTDPDLNDLGICQECQKNPGIMAVIDLFEGAPVPVPATNCWACDDGWPLSIDGTEHQYRLRPGGDLYRSPCEKVSAQ
jgi:hypothetical protein